jgi:hypothetical protein
VLSCYDALEAGCEDEVARSDGRGGSGRGLVVLPSLSRARREGKTRRSGQKCDRGSHAPVTVGARSDPREKGEKRCMDAGAVKKVKGLSKVEDGRLRVGLTGTRCWSGNVSACAERDRGGFVRMSGQRLALGACAKAEGRLCRIGTVRLTTRQ